MSVTKEEIERLVSVQPKIERLATLSSDGKNLLARIPKEVRESLGLEKGDQIRFMIQDNNKITLEIVKDAKKKKERN